MNPEEGIGVLVHGRAQVMGVDQREDCGVEPDTKSKRYEDRARQQSMFSEAAHRVAQIQPKISKHDSPPTCSQYRTFRRHWLLDPLEFPRQQFVVTQLRKRSARGFFWRRAADQQLHVAIFQMLSQFLDDLRFARSLETQGRQPASDFWFPVVHLFSLADCGFQNGEISSPNRQLQIPFIHTAVQPSDRPSSPGAPGRSRPAALPPTAEAARLPG